MAEQGIIVHIQQGINDKDLNNYPFEICLVSHCLIGLNQLFDLIP